MRPLLSSAVLLHILTSNAAIDTLQTKWKQHPLPIRDLYQWPLLTWIQGMAISANGNIHMNTVSPDASIWLATGTNTHAPIVSRVHKFENLNAVTGIVETQAGIYTFRGGNETSIGKAVMDTFRVWELDTRQGAKPIITERVHVPGVGLLAALIPVSNTSNTILVSDSTLGQIYRINLATGEHKTILKDATMDLPAWSPVPFGIGGMQLHKGYLYFVNCFRALLYRVKFTDDGYPVPGAKIELVLELQAIFLDGFVIDPEDTIWAATDADNRLLAVTPDGSITVVSGALDELTVAGVVTGVFGTLAGDEKTFYCVTNGGMNVPINGTMIEGGKLAAVNTSSSGKRDTVSSVWVYMEGKNSQRPDKEELIRLVMQPARYISLVFMDIIAW
ncbi:hypothetical protein NX059_009655 [Plenodomus lindquistii]|nr:hypothetical protein NX059_009655 [Plenodomus lindquistii]